MSEKTMLATMTGENFQPVRLHYQVFDHSGLLDAFKKLRCIDQDPTRSRRVWLYDHEARNLSFKKSYADIPRQHHPIVIGSFFLRGEDNLLLDLRSFERAKLAIPFFDKHIPRSAARVREAEVVNRLFSAEEVRTTPDQLFDRQQSVARDPEAALRDVTDVVADVQDPLERLRIASELVEAQAKQSLPEIERFPIHFYEDGIGAFSTSLTLRQLVAFQHWLGNTNYSMADVIRETVKRLG